jgi:hypothetical protein
VDTFSGFAGRFEQGTAQFNEMSNNRKKGNKFKKKCLYTQSSIALKKFKILYAKRSVADSANFDSDPDPTPHFLLILTASHNVQNLSLL